MLKKLTGSIAIFSALIIIFGLIKLYLYYLKFDVPINYFITISEIGIIVSDDLLILSLFFGIILLGEYFLIDTKIPIEIVEKENKERKQRLRELKLTNLKDYKKIISSKIFLILVVTIGSVIVLISFSDYGTKLILISALVFMIPYFMLMFEPILLYKHLSSNTGYIYVTFKIFFITYTVLIGKEISNVEKGKYVGTIIKTKDSSYISTKERYFIGKTDKFLFFYDAMQKATTIIPTEKVESIILKQK